LVSHVLEAIFFFVEDKNSFPLTKTSRCSSSAWPTWTIKGRRASARLVARLGDRWEKFISQLISRWSSLLWNLHSKRVTWIYQDIWFSALKKMINPRVVFSTRNIVLCVYPTRPFLIILRTLLNSWSSNYIQFK